MVRYGLMRPLPFRSVGRFTLFFPVGRKCSCVHNHTICFSFGIFVGSLANHGVLVTSASGARSNVMAKFHVKDVVI